MSRVFLILGDDAAKAVQAAVQSRIEYLDDEAPFWQPTARRDALVERAHLSTVVGQLKEPA